MTSRELAEWQAFYLYVEPFGGKFFDMQFAALRRQNYGGKDNPAVEDFMLFDYSMLTPEQKEQEQRAVAEQQARAQALELRDFLMSKIKQSEEG